MDSWSKIDSPPAKVLSEIAHCDSEDCVDTALCAPIESEQEPPLVDEGDVCDYKRKYLLRLAACALKFCSLVNDLPILWHLQQCLVRCGMPYVCRKIGTQQLRWWSRGEAKYRPGELVGDQIQQTREELRKLLYRRRSHKCTAQRLFRCDLPSAMTRLGYVVKFTTSCVLFPCGVYSCIQNPRIGPAPPTRTREKIENQQQVNTIPAFRHLLMLRGSLGSEDGTGMRRTLPSASTSLTSPSVGAGALDGLS